MITVSWVECPPALDDLERSLHPVSAFLVIPIFALANAGVDLRGGVLGDAFGHALTWGVIVGLILGKGDQGFWAQRVHDLGVGPAPLPVRRLSVDELADRLRTLGQEANYRRRAQGVSEELRLEDGVAKAVGILEQLSSTNT